MRALYIEPFEGGSHAAFTRALTQGLDIDWTVLTLPARHWKWRMRGSAAWFALHHADALSRPYDLVFACAYLPLAELLGLAPALAAAPRVLYFHENQLAYPVREAWSGRRDLHFGFTQLVSGLAATRCAFNSRFNRDSFLREGRDLLQRMPDAVPSDWVDRLEARSVVLPLPLELPADPPLRLEPPSDNDRAAGPIILWNHRWEYDKNPEAFFNALIALDERGTPFRLAVCGQRFRKAPAVFAQARERLSARVIHWGYLPSADAYRDLLQQAHIAVSSADHEFFGISMVEACHWGARPVVPDRLAYREIFPEDYRYPDDAALADTLDALCRAWVQGDTRLRADRRALTEVYQRDRVLPRYMALFGALQGADQT